MKRAFRVLLAVALALGVTPISLSTAAPTDPSAGGYKLGRPIQDFLSSDGAVAHDIQQLGVAGALATREGQAAEDPGGNGSGDGGNQNGRRNVFVNDPCLDPSPQAPFPENFRRTVQSEDKIAVLNSRSSRGRDIVVGYNNSWGFYDNTQGLSAFAYSTDGGRSFIDGGGLPPVVKSHARGGTPGSDTYFGDPVVVVDNQKETFYYASIYQTPTGIFSLSVNRGHFTVAPPQGIESKSNTRCANDPSKYGVPDPPATIRKRVIWEPPVVAVPILAPGDFLDKEWLHVDQRTHELYLVYVRIGADSSTPLELVRSFDGGYTWTPPTIIVPNLDDTFNTGLSVVTTQNGRVVVSWYARTFSLSTFQEVADRIESAFSDNDGVTFAPTSIVKTVNPQGDPKGYNRGQRQLLDYAYLATDPYIPDEGGSGGNDQGLPQGDASNQNVYVVYFDGKTPLGLITQAADILLSASHDGGTTWGPPVKVNDDNTNTSHLFPSVVVNREGRVFVAWIDRRVDPVNNILNDTWAAACDHEGQACGTNARVTNVSTDWFVRADFRPNFGDYNSSDLIDYETLATVWADGRFPTGTFIPTNCLPFPPPGQTCPPRRSATPDSIFALVPELSAQEGTGNGGGGNIAP